MGGSKKAVNPPLLGSLIAGPPNGLEHTAACQAAGLGITEHPR